MDFSAYFFYCKINKLHSHVKSTPWRLITFVCVCCILLNLSSFCKEWNRTRRFHLSIDILFKSTTTDNFTICSLILFTSLISQLLIAALMKHWEHQALGCIHMHVIILQQRNQCINSMQDIWSLSIQDNIYTFFLLFLHTQTDGTSNSLSSSSVQWPGVVIWLMHSWAWLVLSTYLFWKTEKYSFMHSPSLSRLNHSWYPLAWRFTLVMGTCLLIPSGKPSALAVDFSL